MRAVKPGPRTFRYGRNVDRANGFISDSSQDYLDRHAPPVSNYRWYGSDRPLHEIQPGSDFGKLVADRLRKVRWPLYGPFVDGVLVESGASFGRFWDYIAADYSARRTAEWGRPVDLYERLNTVYDTGRIVGDGLQVAWDRIRPRISRSRFAAHWDRLEEITAVSDTLETRPLQSGSLTAERGMNDAFQTTTLFIPYVLRALPKLKVKVGDAMVPLGEIMPISLAARENDHLFNRIAALNTDHLGPVSSSMSANPRLDLFLDEQYLTAQLVCPGHVRIDYEKPLSRYVPPNLARGGSERRYETNKCPALMELDGASTTDADLIAQLHDDGTSLGALVRGAYNVAINLAESIDWNLEEPKFTPPPLGELHF